MRAFVPLRRCLVDRREDLAARYGITVVAIEEREQLFADGHLQDLDVLIEQGRPSNVRGVAHRDHRRLIMPSNFLQDSASRQQVHLST